MARFRLEAEAMPLWRGGSPHRRARIPDQHLARIIIITAGATQAMAFRTEYHGHGLGGVTIERQDFLSSDHVPDLHLTRSPAHHVRRVPDRASQAVALC